MSSWIVNKEFQGCFFDMSYEIRLSTKIILLRPINLVLQHEIVAVWWRRKGRSDQYLLPLLGVVDACSLVDISPPETRKRNADVTGDGVTADQKRRSSINLITSPWENYRFSHNPIFFSHLYSQLLNLQISTFLTCFYIIFH